MKNYEAKYDYLYEHQDGQCPVCKKPVACYFEYAGYKDDLHHLLRNHKFDRKNYPLLIDSIINLVLVHHEPCHIQKHGSCGSMLHYQADKWERFLERHPAIARWVNNPVGNLFKEVNQ